ncbi:MAG: OstA-like protein [Chloroflexota bacterium]
MKFEFNYIKLLFLISLIPAISFAAPRGAPIELIYADSLVGSQDLSGKERVFAGNVQFRQGIVNVKCDIAKQFLSENRVELQGNVVITQNALTLKAPRVNYNGNTYVADAQGGVTITENETYLRADKGFYSTKTRVADFLGNVFIEDDSARIYSRAISHNRNNRESFATGRVRIEGKYTNVILTGDTVRNYPARNYSLATGDPQLLQIDTVKAPKPTLDTSAFTFQKDLQLQRNRNKSLDSLPIAATDTAPKIQFDTLSIISRIMEGYRARGEEKYIFTDSVEIIRGAIAAKSDSAQYYKDEERFFLRGTPVVWYDSTQLYADSIEILTPQRKVRKLSALGNSFAASRNDSTNAAAVDQISGRQIILDFDRDKISKIFSEGDAKSLYFVRVDSAGSGISRSSGDTIIIEMDTTQKPLYIYWIKQIPGEYYPYYLVAGKEETFYLPGFKWTATRPRKPVSELPRKGAPLSR